MCVFFSVFLLPFYQFALSVSLACEGIGFCAYIYLLLVMLMVCFSYILPFLPIHVVKSRYHVESTAVPVAPYNFSAFLFFILVFSVLFLSLSVSPCSSTFFFVHLLPIDLCSSLSFLFPYELSLESPEEITHCMELPFQWDDGNYISPFVPSSSDALEGLATWMHNSKMLRGTDTLRITDLGCGDGSALFLLCNHLFALRDESYPLQLTAAGVDLDEELIDTARKNADKNVVFSPHCLQCEFSAGNILHYDMERLFSSDNVDTHVLFLYLLPEALHLLRAKLLEVSRRVCLIASNRWDIPFLSKWKIGQIQTIHLYHVRGSEDAAP